MEPSVSKRSGNTLRPSLPSNRKVSTANLELNNMAMVTSTALPTLRKTQASRTPPQKLAPVQVPKLRHVDDLKVNAIRQNSAALNSGRRSSLSAVKLEPMVDTPRSQGSAPTSRPSSRYQVLPTIQSTLANEGSSGVASVPQPTALASTSEKLELAFRFSNGKRIVRSFESTAKLREVFTAIKVDPRRFELSNNADRVTYGRLDATLQALQISNRTLLLVIPK